MNEMEENTVRILSHARSQPTLFFVVDIFIDFYHTIPQDFNEHTVHESYILYVFLIFLCIIGWNSQAALK